MKKIVFIASILIIAVSASAQAGIIWQENFNGYSSNWSCTDGDCEAGCPSGYVGCRGDQSVAGGPDIEISTAYERSNPGPSNRGYRVWVYDGTSGTCCENVLRKSVPAGTNFYLRWYMRLSTNKLENYWKMFRMFSNGTQIFILEPKYRYSWGETRFNLSNGTGSAEANWTQWVISKDYTPDTWVCMEVFINQTNGQATLWVDGASKGTISISQLQSSNYSIDRIEIGGNQSDIAGGNDNYMDYDDVVVSTTYIGPANDNGGTVDPLTPPSALKVTEQ